STPTLMASPEISAFAAVPSSPKAAAQSAILETCIAFSLFCLSLPIPSHRSDSEVGMELVHVLLEAIVGDLVDHLAVLDHVVAVGDGRGEAKVLLDEQDGE